MDGSEISATRNAKIGGGIETGRVVMTKYTDVKHPNESAARYLASVRDSEYPPDGLEHDLMVEQQSEEEDSLEAEQRPLPDTVNGLGAVVSELKEQLTNLVRVNEALECDLEQAAEVAAEGKKDRYLLVQKIRSMEEKAETMEDLKLEGHQLSTERDALVDRVHELSQALVASEQRVMETSGVLDRFRAERNDADHETVCLNSQFSRAMKVIDELRAEQANTNERETGLKQCIEELKQQVSDTVSQRETFKKELAASRMALEEVRESLIAASRESHNAIYGDAT